MLVTHYWRHCPESDQCNEVTERLTFNESHRAEAIQSTARVPLPSNPCALSRRDALELVNKWNRNAEHYRYWIEP